MRAARHEGDVGARFRQRHAKSTADPAGADHRNPHGCSPELFGLSDPVQRAELVAVGIAQISKIEFTHGGFAHAGRFFARFAAMGDAGRMPGIGLLGGVAAKPMVPPLAGGRRLAVDRQRYGKRPVLVR